MTPVEVWAVANLKYDGGEYEQHRRQTLAVTAKVFDDDIDGGTSASAMANIIGGGDGGLHRLRTDLAMDAKLSRGENIFTQRVGGGDLYQVDDATTVFKPSI